ncbi:cytochrome c peroxidase, partial [Gilvimarinus sp. SDUM040013]|uniref:cytochrome c peroxidase n=1 Tax=Gilvimarinus gilvus TaxID=3058038 RepID=UPI00267222EF
MNLRLLPLLSIITLLSACSSGQTDSASHTPAVPLSKEALGQQLYFDSNLSLNRTQSCATCH